MSAWYLKRKLGDLCRITLYEASNRLGGKIVTRKFDSAPAMYEAGVAEIYDYSMTGPDPLRELIQHFGLQTIPILTDGPNEASVAVMKRLGATYVRTDPVGAFGTTIVYVLRRAAVIG